MVEHRASVAIDFAFGESFDRPTMTPIVAGFPHNRKTDICIDGTPCSPERGHLTMQGRESVTSRVHGWKKQHLPCVSLMRPVLYCSISMLHSQYCSKITRRVAATGQPRCRLSMTCAIAIELARQTEFHRTFPGSRSDGDESLQVVIRVLYLEQAMTWTLFEPRVGHHA